MIVKVDLCREFAHIRHKREVPLSLSLVEWIVAESTKLCAEKSGLDRPQFDIRLLKETALKLKAASEWGLPQATMQLACERRQQHASYILSASPCSEE